MINNILTEITELTQLLVGIAAVVGAIIRYLLSLPDKIKKFFQECIQKFQELIKIVSDIFASPLTGGTFSGLTDFKNTVNTITNQLNQAKNSLISIASFPSAFAEAIVNPSSSDTTAVEKIMNGYMNNLITTSKTIYDRNMMSSNTQGAIV